MLKSNVWLSYCMTTHFIHCYLQARHDTCIMCHSILFGSHKGTESLELFKNVYHSFLLPLAKSLKVQICLGHLIYILFNITMKDPHHRCHLFLSSEVAIVPLATQRHKPNFTKMETIMFRYKLVNSRERERELNCWHGLRGNSITVFSFILQAFWTEILSKYWALVAVALAFHMLLQEHQILLQ